MFNCWRTYVLPAHWLQSGGKGGTQLKDIAWSSNVFSFHNKDRLLVSVFSGQEFTEVLTQEKVFLLEKFLEKSLGMVRKM